jgi:hypothetical protein
MAFRRRLGNLAGEILSRRLDRKQAEYQSELIRKRQMEMEGINTQQQILSRILQDPDLAERIRARMPQVAGVDVSSFIPTTDQMGRKAATELSKVTDLAAVPTQEDIQGQYGGRVPIETLLAQAEARRKAITGAEKPVEQNYINDAGVKVSERVNPYDAMGRVFQQERTGEQEGSRKGAEQLATLQTPGLTETQIGTANQLEAGTRAEKVKTVGAETTAREAAQFPFQMRLAQTRADLQFQQKKEWDEWQTSHPKATTQERNKASNAIAALSSIGEIRQMLDEMDKRGLLGPISGRAAEIAAGRIKAEELFPNKEDATLAANYFSSMKLLSSLAAVTHGGARGGGSIQMVKQFEKVLSGTGDRSIIEGQLNAMERLMSHYKEHPEAPAPMEVPGIPKPGPQARDPRQPLQLDPTIQMLLNRNKGGR